MDQVNIYNRIKHFLKKGKANNHRSMFAVLGAEAAKQIPVFYQILTRGKVKDIPVLCCSNDSSSLRNIDWCPDKISGMSLCNSQDNILSSIQHVTYSDVQDKLHQSFKLVIFQDIESIHLSTFVSIVESVKGGGVLIFLFSKIQGTTEFTLDEISKSIESRFMRRLCISLASCSRCIILDDKMNVLAGDTPNIKDMTSKIVADAEELQKLKAESTNDAINNALINLCKTVDQAKLLFKFINALRKRTFHSIVSVSSPKGRGKSAALGLAIAGSLALNYSNIFISSSSYDNVNTIFSFLLKGMDALNYKEDEDYHLIQAVDPKFNSNLIGVNFFKHHRQTVSFILPEDVENKVERAQLVVIDEAASIALPLLKRLIGSYVIFMASSTKGYGGAGKYSYENMIREIRQPAALKGEGKIISPATLFNSGVNLEQLTLNEPIFYSSGDEVENWINHFLCLDCSVNSRLSHGCPQPQHCRLLYVCPETLFSYESHAEKFLQQLISFFLSSKRNEPSDFLRKIADDTDYHIFCLLSPFHNTGKVAPEILCAILVHNENRIPSNIAQTGVDQSEDLNTCFNQWKNIADYGMPLKYLPKNGIHIIDIVTHPEYKKMGYGSRALQLLQEFYDGKCLSLEDNSFIYSRKNNNYLKEESQPLPPLLLQLTEVKLEKVEYLLVSYFLTPELLKFWKRGGFVPLFISKIAEEEYLCFMMKSIDKDFDYYMQKNWIYFREYCFISLSEELESLPSSTALNLLKSNFSNQLPKEELTKEEIDITLNPYCMKIFEKYCRNLVGLQSIMPYLSSLTQLYFSNCFNGIVLPVVQEVILLSLGLQKKTVEDVSKNLGLSHKHIHGLFMRTIQKLVNYLNSIIEKTIEKTLSTPSVDMQPLTQTIDEELEEAAQMIKLQQQEEIKKLKEMDFSRYAIKGSEEDWEKALHTGRKTLVSIKSIKKAPEDVEIPHPKKNTSFKSKHKFMKKKR